MKNRRTLVAPSVLCGLVLLGWADTARGGTATPTRARGDLAGEARGGLELKRLTGNVVDVVCVDLKLTGLVPGDTVSTTIRRLGAQAGTGALDLEQTSWLEDRAADCVIAPDPTVTNDLFTNPGRYRAEVVVLSRPGARGFPRVVASGRLGGR